MFAVWTAARFAEPVVDVEVDIDEDVVAVVGVVETTVEVVLTEDVVVDVVEPLGDRARNAAPAIMTTITTTTIAIMLVFKR